MVWPTSEDPADDTANPVLRHARAVHIRLPASVTRVELADRSALEDLARGFDCPLVEGDDGWEGVLSGDVVYWARTRIPPAPVDSAAVSRPALLASAGQGSPLAGLGLAGETAAAAL
jgi:hypothetical protein